MTADQAAGSTDPALLTIEYIENEDGWVTAQIVEFPAAISQGSTRHEAWVNVLEAVRDLTHEPTPVERVAFTVQARIIEPLDRLRIWLTASRRRPHAGEERVFGAESGVTRFDFRPLLGGLRRSIQRVPGV